MEAETDYQGREGQGVKSNCHVQSWWAPGQRSNVIKVVYFRKIKLMVVCRLY